MRLDRKGEGTAPIDCATEAYLLPQDSPRERTDPRTQSRIDFYA